MDRLTSKRIAGKLGAAAIESNAFQDCAAQVERRLEMEHKIYRVVSFEHVRPFTLQVIFDDGKKQTIDFRPILIGEIYGPLQDEKFFREVEIDPEVHTLVWPNGADFDPATLHDWPEYLAEMKKMAKRWSKADA